MDSVGRIEGEASQEVVGPVTPDRRRDSLFMSAQLRIDDAPAVYEVRVRNLSTGGLMVEFDRFIEPGTTVSLEMNGLGELTGSVAWCTRGRAGIAFDAPIDPKRARKPVGTGRTNASYPKPVLVARGPRR